MHAQEEIHAIDSAAATLGQVSAAKLAASSDRKRTAAALEEEISFVASFMTTLTKGMSKGKEDEELLRKRKARKKEINRASAKRKRARAKQDLENLANQCHQLERETKQLKDDNARLIAVIRDELEKRSFYMTQIEYLKTTLQQQRQQEELDISQPDASDSLVTTNDTLSPQSAAAMPLGAAEPPTPLVPPVPPSNSIEQLEQEQPPSNGSHGAYLLQLLSQTGPALQCQLEAEQPGPEVSPPHLQEQQQDSYCQQQQLQGLVDLLGAASHASAAGAPAPGSDPVLSQETLNQLQRLLTTFISAASGSSAVTVTSDPTSDAARSALAVPPTTSYPPVQVTISHEAAQQLQGILSVLASGTAGAQNNSASTLGGQAGSEEDALAPPPPET
jgi:hypothetical protein